MEVLLRGYRNRAGETDLVLAGPRGVWAVEVKLGRILLHAVGERWTQERLDARGRMVQVRPAVDGGGRCWGRQVGEVAAGLQAWLHRQGLPVPVRTAVMLMDPDARVGMCQDPGVDMIGTHPRQLLHAVGDRTHPLSAHDVARIVRFVERDHAFHNRRRPTRGPGGPDGRLGASVG